MRLSFLPLLLLFVAGCVTPPPPAPHFSRPANLFPADGFITQRAVLTARGRQFPLNGYLALSRTGGQRLVLTENFGHVLADVLVKPDGQIFVMQSSRLFPPKYIRRGVAADVQCLFGNSPGPDCPVENPGPNHFIIRRHGYTVDVRILDVKTGVQRADLFDPRRAGTP